MNKKIATKKLTVSAIFIALSVVLSFVKIYKLPLGGSITLLSMLPVCLIAIMYGTRWGIFCSFIYSLVQLFMGLGELMSWGMDVRMWLGAVVFDNLLAFTVLGLSGIFRKHGHILKITGVALAIALRFVCHFISGAIFFDIWMPEEFSNSFLYSFVYNGSYMLPEMIITVIGATLILLVPEIKKEINRNM